MRLRAAVSAAADRTAPNVEKRRNTVLCRAPAKSAPIRGAPARPHRHCEGRRCDAIQPLDRGGAPLIELNMTQAITSPSSKLFDPAMAASSRVRLPGGRRR